MNIGRLYYIQYIASSPGPLPPDLSKACNIQRLGEGLWTRRQCTYVRTYFVQAQPAKGIPASIHVLHYSSVYVESMCQREPVVHILATRSWRSERELMCCPLAPLEWSRGLGIERSIPFMTLTKAQYTIVSLCPLSPHIAFLHLHPSLPLTSLLLHPSLPLTSLLPRPLPKSYKLSIAPPTPYYIRNSGNFHCKYFLSRWKLQKVILQ